MGGLCFDSSLATFPKFVVKQVKEKANNFAVIIKRLSRQSFKRNASQKCCAKSTTKDEDIEATYMSRHS